MPNTVDTPRQKLTGTLIGLLFSGAGVAIMLMVWRDPSLAQVPLWIVYVAAGAFVAAGLWIIAQTFGQTGLATLFGVAIAWLLALTGIGVMLSDVACNVSFGDSSFTTTTSSGGWMCRTFIGLGGLLALTIAMAFTWAAIRQRFRSNRTG